MQFFVILVIILITFACKGAEELDSNVQNYEYVHNYTEENFYDRIVGGENANIKDFPYHVSLQINGSHICGASIIAVDWILTAAHCVDYVDVSMVSFRSGSSYHNKGGIINSASNIYIHPLYDPDEFDYDYAVIHVKTKFQINNTRIGIIRLASIEPKPLALSVVVGWGDLEFNGSASILLQQVRIYIFPRQICEQIYENFTERMLCAGHKKGGKDTCQGDSGSALVSNGLLVGIVSWGEGCGWQGFPGVYSNVAAGFSWIQETLKQNSNRSNDVTINNLFLLEITFFLHYMYNVIW